jgi:hypothetical protein
LFTGGLFLPLSLHASFSDIRKRALPIGTERLLLLCGTLAGTARAYYFGIPEPAMTLIANAIPLGLILIGVIMGRIDFGDFEYALSMSLCYPCLCEATSFMLLRGILSPLRIYASVTSIALMNAVLITWLFTFSRTASTWFRERGLSGKAGGAVALVVPILIPRALLLTPYISKLACRRDAPTAELPLIPFMFIGFMTAYLAHVILL